MDTRVCLDDTRAGFRACTLENEFLAVAVIPGFGAKTHELVYKPLERDLLFHHPRVELRAPVFGVNVDNWWTGGIDDALPTGHPCHVAGEDLPFLGEAWSLPWSVERVDDETLRFCREGVITPFRIERWMSLREGESFVRLRHRITNIGLLPFSFIWGIHPGLPIGPATRIQVPGRRAVIDESFPADRLGGPGVEYPWPHDEMTALASEPRGTWDLHYVTDLTDGWFAVRDDEWGTGFGMTFPPELFRCVWVWLVDGGWRGIRCVAVEPWLGYPARLDLAITEGNAFELAPGEELAVETRLIAFTATGPISGFDGDSNPIQKGA